MITVYSFGSMGKLPDLSPFVMKLETYLRMTKRPYQKAFGDTRTAPKKKLPYIDDDGQRISDSSAIIEHLKGKYGDPLDEERLDPLARATARAWKSLFETDLYFIVTYLRWWRDEDFAVYRPALSDYLKGLGLPRLLWPIVLGMARRGTKAQSFHQGTGRHSHQEVLAMGQELLGAVSDFLGDKPFFLGDQPTSLDATAYAFLTGVLWGPFEGPLKAFAQSRPNLAAYCDRLHAAYWSDAAVR